MKPLFDSAEMRADGFVFGAPGAPAGMGGVIRVDDAGLIFRGDYVRDGADLVISGDGHRLVVPDYFSAAHRPKLVAPNGASLSDAVIDALARPAHGVQVAQAGDPPATDASSAIGRVQSLTGAASVVRNGVTVALHTGDLVFKGDVVQTDRGSGLSVSFLDGSVFSLAASARMVLNELVYQAGGSDNHSLINLVQGSLSFVAGQVAKTGDMKVGTPVATMGIRGTAVKATVESDDGTSRLSVMTEPPSTEHPQGHTGRFDVFDSSDPNLLLATVDDPNRVLVVHPRGSGDVRVETVAKTPAEINSEHLLVQTMYQTQAEAPRLPVYNGPATGGGTSSGTAPNQILPNPQGTTPGDPGNPGGQVPGAAPGTPAPGGGTQAPGHAPEPGSSPSNDPSHPDDPAGGAPPLAALPLGAVQFQPTVIVASAAPAASTPALATPAPAVTVAVTVAAAPHVTVPAVPAEPAAVETAPATTATATTTATQPAAATPTPAADPTPVVTPVVTPAAPTPAGTSGRIVDGYVSGATVFADANGNGVRDPGEAFAQSDASGTYTLVGGTGPIVAVGGTDVSTGLPNLLTLTAPSGATVVTPLTTLVQNLGGSAASGAQVAAAFGFTGVDLSSFDPYAAAASGTAEGRSAYLANVAVADTALLLSTALIGQGVTADAAYAAVLNQIALATGGLAAGATLDLSDSTVLGSLLAGAATALHVTPTQTAIDAVVGIPSGTGGAAASNHQLAGITATGQPLLDQVITAEQSVRTQVTALQNQLAPPRIDATATLTIASDGTGQLSALNLHAIDPNNSSGTITYTVAKGSVGYFTDAGSGSVTSFTQADIDSGAVVYHDTGSVPGGGAESLTLRVTTAGGGSSTVNLPLNHTPVLAPDTSGPHTMTAVPAGGLAPQSTAGASYLTAGSSLVNGLGGAAGFGETVLGTGDDNSSERIAITGVFGEQGLNFFGRSYTGLYVNNNGNITFDGASTTFTPSQITASTAAIIAPFFADVDTVGHTARTAGGNSTGSNRVYIDADAAHHVFTVTWDDVGVYGNVNTQHPDAFQLQLVGLGNGNFDIVYRYEAVNWTRGRASDVDAVAGYAAGNGTNFYELPQSGSALQLQALPSTPGNTGIDGVYVFQAYNGSVSASGMLQSTATLGFTDADTSDTHGVTLGSPSLTWSAGERSFALSTLDSTDSAQLDTALAHALTATVTEGSGQGSVALSFSAANDAFAFLGAGESLTARYDVAVTDGAGAISHQTVTFTVDGTNDAPVVAALAEDSAGTAEPLQAGSGPVSTSGTLTVTDPDVHDSVTVTASLHGHAGPTGALTDTDLAAFFQTSTASGTITGGGSAQDVTWHFDAGSGSFQYLAQGETLTLSYDVHAADDSGAGNATGDGIVTITIAGTNDAPVVAADVSGTGSDGTGIGGLHAITEIAGQTGSASLDTASATLTFTDADLSDTHTVAHGTPTFAWSGGTLSADQLTALTSASSLTLTETDSTHTGSGSVAVGYSAPDEAFDFLAQGQTLSVTYTVSVTDEHGATASQPVTFTVTGTNDAPTASGTHAITLAQGGTVVLTSTEFSASDPDNTHAQLTYTVAPTGSGSFGYFTDANVGSASVTSFTQADIDDGAVVYHSNGNTGSATLGFTLSDGSATTTGSLAVTVSALPPLQSAGTGGVQASPATPGVTALTQRQLDGIVAAAANDWRAAGATAAQIALLAATTFTVADLSGTALGQEADGHVTIDADAAGSGWYVDPTPADNAEFPHAVNAAGSDRLTDPAQPAAGHYDLLTVVMHEMGHVLGLPDLATASAAGTLMDEDLAVGERRLPTGAEVSAATAASATGGAAPGTTHYLHAASPAGQAGSAAAGSSGHAGDPAEGRAPSAGADQPASDHAGPDHAGSDRAGAAPEPASARTEASTEQAGHGPDQTGPTAATGQPAAAPTGPVTVPAAVETGHHTPGANLSAGGAQAAPAPVGAAGSAESSAASQTAGHAASGSGGAPQAAPHGAAESAHAEHATSSTGGAGQAAAAQAPGGSEGAHAEAHAAPDPAPASNQSGSGPDNGHTGGQAASGSGSTHVEAPAAQSSSQASGQTSGQSSSSPDNGHGSTASSGAHADPSAATQTSGGGGAAASGASQTAGGSQDPHGAQPADAHIAAQVAAASPTTAPSASGQTSGGSGENHDPASQTVTPAASQAALSAPAPEGSHAADPSAGGSGPAHVDPPDPSQSAQGGSDHGSGAANGSTAAQADPTAPAPDGGHTPGTPTAGGSSATAPGTGNPAAGTGADHVATGGHGAASAQGAPQESGQAHAQEQVQTSAQQGIQAGHAPAVHDAFVFSQSSLTDEPVPVAHAAQAPPVAGSPADPGHGLVHAHLDQFAFASGADPGAVAGTPAAQAWLDAFDPQFRFHAPPAADTAAPAPTAAPDPAAAWDSGDGHAGAPVPLWHGWHDSIPHALFASPHGLV